MNPHDVSPKSYKKCILIEKNTEESLFPKILRFKSQQEFILSRNNNNYSLAIDLNEKNKELNSIINQANSLLENLNLEKRELFKKIKGETLSFLNNETSKNNKKIKIIKTHVTNLNGLLKEQADKINSLEEKERITIESNNLRLKKEYSKKRYDIMKKYKGLYSYHWKYRRKSWDFSKKIKYLDFKDYIFEIIDENVLRKIEKKEFIWKVKKDFNLVYST